VDVDVCVDVSAGVGVGVGLELLSVSLHYGLTGGWVQKFKGLCLAYFLQCALTDYARGKA